ncbi:ATP-binding protein [Nocardiopsis dassonvillei]|uniref:IstB domain protein ATP-binding protein n=1 Tax=Nocardiopsis dassonvillei (strain ATCC 23218 / DSM 43111 / CIP 107115 / JCM 7437 / KCTC 9190 / NBRC 14626 / NCTC 10488 / NRRL B-5397 / IMRU 509) TaxID=446468 RepID=D7AX71_NOCDD|nr:ATP-binding protein [Nocardiopsis dassonvillei]ADH69841.1 IstB domain protein ATP-binding protein [Nocardiopsis dassonvillei subsp. dassonvillei DSM 43111]NKY78884.1 ATP-binding protein [Nocardiopsis dassonvillei]VEI90353.1 Chromosomal replication initiator protein DnaA [Nocardiopsis dassonvillei]
MNTATATPLLTRLARIAHERGLDTTPGPVDDDPHPDLPGHPAYHHRQRVNAALTKFERATPPRYLTASTEHPRVCDWADQVAADVTQAPSLMLWGGTGTGKTHAAFGAVRRIALTGPIRFGFLATTFPDLYAALRPGAGNDEERERLMRRVLSVPVLLLDDLGTTKSSLWTEETTYRIVNHRYNRMLPVVITSNEPPAALPELLGDRIASRLIEMTTRVEMTGTDRRLSR